MHSEPHQHLARLAWRHLLADHAPFRSERVVELLSPVIDASVVRNWLARVDPGELRGGEDDPIESIEQCVDDDARRDQGLYLTPRPLADALAAGVEAEPGAVVLDLSAGAATLLAAVGRRHPHVTLVGVEKNPLLAVAAAINLVALRRRQGEASSSEHSPPVCDDRIFVGDGLARDPRWWSLAGRVAAVVGNPPYVREKGNRERFQVLRSEHPHLDEYFGARMDLQYLFFHQGASFLRPGGRMMMLTTAYWLAATNADKVRRDMTTRLSPEALVRLEKAGAFADAPGQHSLISIFRRPEPAPQKVCALSLADEPDDWPALIEALLGGELDRSDLCEPAAETLGEGTWAPFVDASTVSWGRRLRREGTPLGELLGDRQGFVSGADRFSGRHRKYYDTDASSPQASLPEKGAPIFLFDRDELPADLVALAPTVVRPLLRARQLAANDVVLTPPRGELALYIDGPIEGPAREVVEHHLGQFRPVLERRREVRKGSMPWYRLHWPRDRAEQTGPKLVVPRRAPAPCFALDLSASVVSSDCTYLVAPEDVTAPLEYLVTLMVVLNSAPVARYLRHFGKTKGTQLEFYSHPLRSLPVPLHRVGGRLQWIDGLIDPALRAECEEHIDRLRGSR